jgi:Ca2+-binding RTX toxin-like protein
MIGGYGDDYFITNGSDTILESVGQGTDTVESTVNYSLGDNIENLILAGSRVVDGTGNALGNNVTGNGEANLLRGMAGNDTVSGMSGNDTLDGGSGRDILSGGKGNDRIIGGSGSDVFVFNRGDGTDTVTDFVNGLDVMQIANGAEKFADITVLDSGSNVTISFANVKVTLLNLNHSSIDASDFAFV